MSLLVSEDSNDFTCDALLCGLCVRSRSKLIERDRVPVGILEPRDLRTARKRHDTEFVLSKTFDDNKLDSAFLQLRNYRCNIGDVPSDRGIRRDDDLAYLLHAKS